MSDSLVAANPPHLLRLRHLLPASSSPPPLLNLNLNLNPRASYSGLRVTGEARKDVSVLAVARISELEEPGSIELARITCERQFDEVLADAEKRKESVVILWMANWCRKCIYLKPKMEKLAAEYYPRARFYCVDVNSVPQSLVNRAGVTKMPTIQLWSDSKLQGEVFGGHTAWLVIEDIRRMIENEET